VPERHLPGVVKRNIAVPEREPGTRVALSNALVQFPPDP